MKFGLVDKTTSTNYNDLSPPVGHRKNDEKIRESHQNPLNLKSLGITVDTLVFQIPCEDRCLEP